MYIRAFLVCTFSQDHLQGAYFYNTHITGSQKRQMAAHLKYTVANWTWNFSHPLAFISNRLKTVSFLEICFSAVFRPFSHGF